MDISYIFLVQTDKILILFGLQARDMPRRRQNIEVNWLIGKILRSKDLLSIPKGAVADSRTKFAHMPYSLPYSTMLSKGCSSQPTN
jgi:hypothetical protein